MAKYYSFLLFALFLCARPLTVAAQYSDDDEEHPYHIKDTGNVFCKQVYRIMKDARDHFAQSKGEEHTSTFAKTYYDVKPSFAFDGARECVLQQELNGLKYSSVWLSRDTKDELVSSYRNLMNQLKDCLGDDYVFTEKKSMAIGPKTYECNITPYHPDAKDRVDFRIMIVSDWKSGTSQLVMEIKAVGV